MARSIKGKSANSMLSARFDPENSKYLAPLSFLFSFLLLIFLFREFIFSDKMLYGSDTLQAGLFFRNFLIENLRENWALPSWNPFIFGGMPFIEAFHGDILYPGTFPGKLIAVWFDNLDRVLGWNLFWHIALSGVFMYKAAREFNLSKVASIVTGASYMFTGYLISLVAPGHDGKIFSATLFPLTMLYLHRGFERRPLLNFSLLGLVIGCIILTPHLQVSYFVLWALCFYTIYRLKNMLMHKRPVLGVMAKGSMVLWAVVIGLGLSAIQFLPGYIYTTEFSPRADSKKGWSWSTSWSMHEEEAMSLIIPEFAGSSPRDRSDQYYYWGKNPFKDNSESAGIVPLFLAIIGLLISKRRDRWFFGGLALFSLSYALAGTTPIYNLYYFFIPKVASLRAASMIMFLFCFSVAMLAGMAVEQLIEARKERVNLSKKFPYLLWGFPVFMFVLALLFNTVGKGMIRLWASVFHGQAATTMIQQGVSKLDLAYMNLPYVQSGAWIGFLVVALTAGIIWMFWQKKAGPAILLVLAVIIAVDGVRFNARFIDVVEDRSQFQPNQYTDFFTRQTDKFRILEVQSRGKSNYLHYFGVEGVVGYHGNQLRWYDDLLGSLQLGHLYQPRLLNLMGVRYLIAPEAQIISPNLLGERPLKVVANFGRFQVMENQNAFPRVFLVDSFIVIPDRMDIYPEVIRGNEDLRRVVFLEKDPNMVIERSNSPDSVVIDSAWVIDYSADAVTIGVESSGNRLLVLTDVWYDAWQVSIDGLNSKCLRADGALRAVAVPSGKHEIKFRFESERYKMGKIISASTLIYLFLVIGLSSLSSLRRKKRKEK